MPKKVWDDALKRLIIANPQHFVSWLLKGAIFKDYVATELKNRTLEADVALEVSLNDKNMLLQIEFQSKKDVNMGQRLLEYNVLANYLHKRLVLSCVIYLRKDREIVESPLVWELPDGHVVLTFHFLVIKLWEIPFEEILQMGFVGLLPLLPLTKDGKQHNVVDKMIESIVTAKEYQLLSLGKIVAGLVFTGEAENEWLQRRFDVFEDILEDSWVYQEILQRGLTKGLEKGVQQGIEKGVQQGIEKGIQQELKKALQMQRQALVKIVQGRFPDMANLAKTRSEAITDTEVLQELLIKISLAESAQETYQALSAVQ